MYFDHNRIKLEINNRQTTGKYKNTWRLNNLLLNKTWAKKNACMLSCFSRVWLSVTLQTVARQAPLSMRFSRQEYWSGLPFPPPGHLPNPEIEPASPALASRFFTTSTMRKFKIF